MACGSMSPLRPRRCSTDCCCSSKAAILSAGLPGRNGSEAANRLFLDIGWDHHAKLVRAWLAWPGCRIKLHFVPAYCSHLDSIERLWRGGVLHKHNAHNRCHEPFAEVKHTIPNFQYDEVAMNEMSIAIRYPVSRDNLGEKPRQSG
jgi:hypothetical protein